MVSFGCTGGQHRSVYAADALTRHLKNKYGVKVKLCHKVQEEKNWCNVPVAEESTKPSPAEISIEDRTKAREYPL